MKKLKVDLDDIAMTMEFSSSLIESFQYFDTETGRVFTIDDSVMNDVEEENYEKTEDYPEWMKEMAKDAEAVLDDDRERFKEIPRIESHESYKIMESFIATVKDKRIQNILSSAIQGRGAFRRFKDTIAEWPDLQKQWFSYKDNTARQEVIDWLESIGIEPIDIKK